MEFKFKRKYTFFFFSALCLHALLIAFWLFAPKSLFNNNEEKNLVSLLILINIELILLFSLGLSRKKYYAYHDKLLIKRSFFSSTTISYKDITRIKERNSDSIILGFGLRPSFKIYYQINRSRKKIVIRPDNYNLLLKIIKNEIDIAKMK